MDGYMCMSSGVGMSQSVVVLVQVPVSFSTRDPWVPVHLNTPGESPRHHAPSRASAPSPGAVSEAQSEDWVLSMNGADVRSR